MSRTENKGATMSDTATPSIRELNPTAQAILGLVLFERTEHRRGPSWSELAEALGLPPAVPPPAETWERAQRYARAECVSPLAALKAGWKCPPDPGRASVGRTLRQLRDGGWIEYSSRERSLDVGPTLLAAVGAP